MARKYVVQQVGKMKPNIFKSTNMNEGRVGEQEHNGVVRKSSRASDGIQVSYESHGIYKKINGSRSH